MGKIQLVIAETEGIFLKKLEDYIINNNVNFDVITFTTNPLLIHYLQRNEADVLLVDNGLYSPEIDSLISKFKIKIIFTSKKDIVLPTGWKSIYKYQKTETILYELTRIYTEVTRDMDVFPKGNKKTKLIAFYSPIGGSGKTTLAFACAISFLEMGVKVFYLNFEKISSTNVYLQTESDENMSDIFNVLRKEASISYKIQSAKVVDPLSKIEYFNPPDSEIECGNLDKGNILKLMNELAEYNEYDFVLIDLSSDFSVNNMTFLEKCDLVVVPITLGLVPLSKLSGFYRELHLRYKMLIPNDKIIVVLNKKEDLASEPTLDVPIQVTIPYLDGIQNIPRLREFWGACGDWMRPLTKIIIQRLK